MRKTLGLAVLLLSQISLGVGQTHLGRLKTRFPYGLIGDDYGVLNVDDLAINTCNAEVGPFAVDKNMAYSYWQCFPLANAKIDCDSLGYDPLEKSERGHMSIEVDQGSARNSYTARDAMDIRTCRKWIGTWQQRTRGERFVCISGSYAASSGARDGRTETDWVFDKFKTRKGCESFFEGQCSLKAQLKNGCVPHGG